MKVVKVAQVAAQNALKAIAEDCRDAKTKGSLCPVSEISCRSLGSGVAKGTGTGDDLMTCKLFACRVFALDSNKTETEAMDIDIGQNVVMLMSLMKELSRSSIAITQSKLQKWLWLLLISIISGNIGESATANTKTWLEFWPIFRCVAA